MARRRKEKGFILVILLSLMLLLAVTAMSLNYKAGMQARMAANGTANVQTYFDQLAVIEQSLWKLTGDFCWRVTAGENYTYNGRTYSRRVFNPDTATYPALAAYADAVTISVQAPDATGRVNKSFRYNIETPFLIRTPRQVARDSVGNIFFADQDNHSVWKIDAATGAITRVAGNGTSGFSGDGGPATQAQLNSPRGVAVDFLGNLYIGTTGDDRVRKVTASGFISTVVNTAGSGGLSGDGGLATDARISSPYGVGVDASGNIYIADTNNHRIRKVTVATGIITTVAGTSEGFAGDGGQATAAKLKNPRSVFCDAAGNIFIADTDNNRIRQVAVATGIINTVAGGGGSLMNGIPATNANLDNPEDVAVDSAGSIYLADTDHHKIRRVTAGIINTIAGTGTAGYSGDGGAATAARIDTPRGLAVKSTGEVIISDTGNSCIRQVSITNTISTLPMTVGPALNSPDGTASYYDSAQKKVFIYIADQENHRIRMLDTVTNTVTTVAGTGTAGFGGDDGPATAAQLNAPSGVAADASGNIFIADTKNHRIREFTVGGNITTVAGTGESGYNSEGTATVKRVNAPEGVATDAAGAVYVADTDNHRIRKFTVGGEISTVAGTGSSGLSGDGGAATSAQLNKPQGVWVDADGNIYIADTENHQIRKVTVATGIINKVAGTNSGYSGDGGAATAAQLKNPQAVSVDGAGNIYVADTDNDAIRLVNHATPPIITTLAGTGASGYNGDNRPAVQAMLNSPRGVALGLTRGCGRIYISDTGNNRVRMLSLKTVQEVYGP